MAPSQRFIKSKAYIYAPISLKIKLQMAHLTKEQRYTISCLLTKGKKQKEIADIIGKDKSVISREISRNKDQRSGSYVRGEQSEKSDIDILIEFAPDKENFDNYMTVYDILENLFRNEKVEIVTKKGLSSHIGPQILKEVLYA